MDVEIRISIRAESRMIEKEEPQSFVVRRRPNDSPSRACGVLEPLEREALDVGCDNVLHLLGDSKATQAQDKKGCETHEDLMTKLLKRLI